MKKELYKTYDLELIDKVNEELKQLIQKVIDDRLNTRLSINKLSAKYNLSASTIIQILNDNGIKKSYVVDK